MGEEGPDFGIIRERLCQQRLVGKPFSSAVEVVEWFGAVQAQDFSGAKWGLAQRTEGSLAADVERAFDAGKILRTHVLRPTWHFVMPADVRFLLELTARRIEAKMASYNKKLALTPALFRKSHAILARALEGGRHATRTELAAELARAGIAAKGQRLGHLMMQAELDKVVISGPRREKQFTYALFDERVPQSRRRSRDEALAELVRRYFTSHGPALPQDFAWWSGLTVADAKRGVEAAGKSVMERMLSSKPYYSARSGKVARVAFPTAHLLPNYDEYLIAYRNYRPIFEPSAAKKLRRSDALAAHIVVLDGKVAGGWRRTLDEDSVEVRFELMTKPRADQRPLLAEALRRYARYLGVSLKT